jgi:hypothetical protein
MMRSSPGRRPAFVEEEWNFGTGLLEANGGRSVANPIPKDTITAKYDVKNGAKQLIAQGFSQDIETVDSPLQIVVPTGSAKTVVVQPGDHSNPKSVVVFLLIALDSYGDEGKRVKYQVNPKVPADPASKWFELEQPHLLLGHGAVKLLDENPTTFSFANGTDVDVSITIHIGRNDPSTKVKPPTAAEKAAADKAVADKAAADKAAADKAAADKAAADKAAADAKTVK